MHKNVYTIIWVPFAFALILSACGGGGGGGNETGSEPSEEEQPINTSPTGNEPATTAPETTLITTPSSLSNKAINVFELSSSEQNVSYEASLNGAPFTLVSNPYQTEELNDGAHQIKIRAVTNSGVADSSPAQFSWVIDTLPPDTIINQTPDEITNNTTAEFHFSSTENSVTFEFSFDGQAYQITTSPIIINELISEEYQISIRSIDAAGNTDPTPASVSWIVDTLAPETILKSSPEALTRNTFAAFEFESNEDLVRYEVSLNGGDFKEIANPFETASLQEGVHTLIVQARDQAQNVDLSPINYSWKIDTTPPDVTLHFPTPSSLTDAELLTIKGIASDANNIKEIQVNGNPATSNDNFKSWQTTVTIQRGNNEIIITSEDKAGNIDTQAAAVNVHGITHMLRIPDRMTLHTSSNTLYIVDDKSIIAHNLDTRIKTILADSSVGSGPTLLEPRGIAIDNTNNRILITDSGLDAVIAIDLTTGQRSIVSDSDSNNNNPLMNPHGIALDEADNVVYVMDSGLKGLIAINLSNGERTVVSNNTIGNGSNFLIPRDIALDKTNSRILYTDILKGTELLAIDIATVATGNRSTLSGNGVGSGPSLRNAWRVSVDAIASQALVTDANLKSIITISLTDGTRKVLSDAAQRGPILQSPTGIFFDAEARRLFVMDKRLDAVFSIDRNTGVRNIVSSDNIGNGPLLNFVKDIFLDGNSITAVENDPYRIISIDINSGERSAGINNATGTGPAILNLSHITPDTAENFILALGEEAADVAPRSKKLLKINTINGDRSVLFENFNNLGAGYSAPTQSGLVIDKNNNEVLLFIPYEEQQNPSSIDRLVAVDLSLLSLQAIAGPVNGNGPAPKSESVTDIALNSNNDALYMIEQDTARLMSVLLPSGTRAVVSDATNGIGSGPDIKRPNEITLNITSEIAYISDIEQNAIFSVDLAEGLGNRQLVSGLDRGTGPLIRLISGLSMHTERDILFFYDPGLNSIVAIEPNSGDRVIISR